MICTPGAFDVNGLHVPRVVHCRPAKRMDVIRYCWAWPTSQLAIVQPRAEATGVLSVAGPNASLSAGAGDGGVALDGVSVNWQARPAATSPVVAIASARAIGAQNAYASGAPLCCTACAAVVTDMVCQPGTRANALKNAADE